MQVNADDPAPAAADASEPVRTTNTRPRHEPRRSHFMLAVAGVVTVAGALVILPPLVSPGLAANCAWASSSQMFLIAILTTSVLAVVGLWHERRHLAVIHDRFDRALEDSRAVGRKDALRLCALLDVTEMIVDREGLEGVIDQTTETCAEVFNCDHVSLMLYREETDDLVVRGVGGSLANLEALGQHQALGEGIAGWAAKRREGLLLAQGCDPAAYPDLRLNSQTIAAAMVVPIVLRDSLVGVINISTQSRAINYDQHDFRAVQVFAGNVAACIRNAQCRDSMKLKINELETLLRTLDRKDIRV